MIRSKKVLLITSIMVLTTLMMAIFFWRTERIQLMMNKQQTAETHIWQSRAGQAQEALTELFWNENNRMFDNLTPCFDLCNDQFNYWWQAHAVDVLVDGYVRTGDEAYSDRLTKIYEGLLVRNAGVFPNEFYDDMEWLAIAFLRAYDATKREMFKTAAITLWEDIKTGWNEQSGGGIAWNKKQLDYKNTPANAPAVILAARLYQRFGNAQDLEWAKRIYDWQTDHLVDPESGFVWDGINRTGDGMIDKAWEFTYCQGVYIGAGVEMFRATKERTYLQDAIRSAEASVTRLTSPITGMLPYEDKGDGGLFKGVYVRYVGELIVEDPSQVELIEMLKKNATSLWNDGKASDQVLFSGSWKTKPEAAVDLSTQLSGMMLLEQMARLESLGMYVNQNL
ncbi:MAG: glycoside hydrolase family 76 protein [Paenibacillaceae bacterium]